MADELDGIDFGADFESFAVGLKPVTVQSVDAISGEVLEEVEDVPAARLVRKVQTVPARSGEVWFQGYDFWLRVDELGFDLKPRDRIVEAAEQGGATWVIDESAETYGTLVRCPVTKMRTDES